ncbi:(d)CMP kinase [Desulfomarina sp.]
MSEIQEIVTIDGPSGVGKSTVSKKIADALGFTYLDTGAMYRAVGLFIHRLGVDPEKEKDLPVLLNSLELYFIPPEEKGGDVGILLNGENVSDIIRTPEVAMVASHVSAFPEVRKKLTEMQRVLGNRGKIVAEGRDMGTVVFPGARYKFFLDADPMERTRRRVVQLREQGVPVDEEELHAMTLKRDKNDRERAIAPLKPAEDAVLLDTTSFRVEDVVEKILQIIERKAVK